MNITIRNCNSIDVANVEIRENCLNIKYGINGTGKSTIAKAITYGIETNQGDDSKLLVLKPFKHITDDDTNNPEIVGIEEINSYLIFNEEYIRQYVFQENEVLKNSFEIFIRNESYEQGLNEINTLIEEIGRTFSENEDIEILINELDELSGTLGNSSESIARSSKFYKAFSNGNTVENIPEGLEPYTDFIRNQENVKWLKWQMSGSDFVGISTCCPFCTSETIEEKIDTINAVKDNYDAKTIEHLNTVIDVINRLRNYLTEGTYEELIRISKCTQGLTDEQKQFMLEIRSQIKVLTEKLNKIRMLEFSTLKKIERVQQSINDFKIRLELLGHLNSDFTKEKVDIINQTLDQILTRAGELEGRVNIQKRRIESTINEYKEDMNTFLKYAGYKYSIDMIEDNSGKEYRMILKHVDQMQDTINQVTNHLSFGERNALALVLFMFDAIKNSPDIIILDDPISSFDKHKKFAIIEMLFRGEKSLKNKTVLMLTHDFDPIVDMLMHNRSIFQPVPKAVFLENIDGQVGEKDIQLDDIKTFIEIANENIVRIDEEINKLIYLRRLYEVTNQKHMGYQLLSNVFKKRDNPIVFPDERNMESDEIEQGHDLVREYIEDFDYEQCISKVKDETQMRVLYQQAANNYEKLQLYRIIFGDNHENRVISKFVNETYHLENDYLYQLNPCKYQLIPKYIIDECDLDLN